MEAKKRTVFSYAYNLARLLSLGALSFSQLAYSAVTVIQDNRSVDWAWSISDRNPQFPCSYPLCYDSGTDTPFVDTSHWVSQPLAYYESPIFGSPPIGDPLQESLISTSSMSGTGLAIVFQVPEGDERRDSRNSSTFDVIFSVDTPTNIDLSGSLWMPPDGYLGRISADVTLYSGAEAIDSDILFERGDTFQLTNSYSVTPPIDFLYQSSLAVGTYRLVIDAGSRIYSRNIGETYWDFEANFSPTTVPVPAAFWLFGTALIGLVGVKRKNNSVVRRINH